MQKSQFPKSTKRSSNLHQAPPSHNSTLEKLQSLKPLREQQQQQAFKNNTNNINTLSNKHRMKTPIRQDRDAKGSTINTNSIRGSQNLAENGRSQKSTQRSMKHNFQYQEKIFDQTVPIEFYNSIESITNIDDVQQQQYYSRQNVEPKTRLNQQNHLEGSVQRDKSPSLQHLAVQNMGKQEPSIYVIKNKKVNQQMHQPNLSQAPPQMAHLNLINSKNKSQLRQDRTPSRATVDLDIKSNVSSRREEFKNKYSTVKSKVRSNLRSKTHKSKGAVLTKQQLMDQYEKQQRREQDIVNLENEVHKIHHDLNYRATNKELILDSYKESRRKSQSRKNTDPLQIAILSQQSDNGDNQYQDSTDESTHRVNITSKKQFSQFEYQIQNFNFSDKYFDKVYLELCGYEDLKRGKTNMIELEKQRDLRTQSAFNEFVASPRSQIQVENQDLVGSVTFFEKRTDQLEKRRKFESEVPEPADEYYEQYGVDSPTQVRRIYDHERDGDFMSEEIAENKHKILDIGDSQVMKKREELRTQNQQLVNDFDNIFKEMIDQRKNHSHMAFYEALNEYNYDKKQLDSAAFQDQEGSFRIAESPTKRLICMKNNQMEHIKQIKDRNLLSNSKQTSMVYMASPERSYVVKSDQKIDYNLAYKKNPLKFYDEALNAPITKHKIQQQRQSISPKNSMGHSEKKSTLGSQASSMSTKNFQKATPNSHIKKKRDHEVYTIVSKTTTRPHNRINTKIKQKIEQKLADKLGSQLTQQVLKALEDANLQEAINDIISSSSNNKKESDQRTTKIHKTMSVQSLPINKFEGEVECNSGEFRMQRNDSASMRNPATRELRTNSNVKIANDRSSKMSQRSGISTRQYNTENNNIEENVKINRAY